MVKSCELSNPDSIRRRNSASACQVFTLLERKKIVKHSSVLLSGLGLVSLAIGPHGMRERPVRGYIYRAAGTRPADVHARKRIGSRLDCLVRIELT